MPWDFSTEPEFQSKLDWMSELVRKRIWPLETLIEELGWDGLQRALKPLQEDVKAQGLWAVHLDPELGGQGFGQVKLGLMHEILGTSPIAPPAFGNAARTPATRRSSPWPEHRSRRSATCIRCWPVI